MARPTKTTKTTPKKVIDKKATKAKHAAVVKETTKGKKGAAAAAAAAAEESSEEEEEEEEAKLPKGVYKVDKIKAERVMNGKKFYLLKWEGFPESANSWEPEKNIMDPSLVEAFKEETAPATKQKQVYWQYYLDKPMDGKKPGWHNYEGDASHIVEKAFQEWQTDPATDVRAVKSGAFSYQVDFNGMTQTNTTHHDHTRRNIRRMTSISE